MRAKITLASLMIIGVFCLCHLFTPKSYAYIEADAEDFPFTVNLCYSWASTLVTNGFGDYWIIQQSTDGDGNIRTGRYDIIGFGVDTINIGSPGNGKTNYYNYTGSGAGGWCKVEFTYDINNSTFTYSSIKDWQTNYLRIYPNCDNYIYSNGVTIIKANNPIVTPTQTYDADYYIGASGFNIQFAVSPNENSIMRGWWCETIDYKLQIQITYNNSPVVFYVQAYEYYVMDVLGTPLSPTHAHLLENPYINYIDKYHRIRYKKSEHGWLDSSHTEYISSLYSPSIEYDNTWIDPDEEFQTVSLSDLVSYLKSNGYPNITFNDFHKDITVSWVGANDNHTYYSTILRYSQVEFPDEAPPTDPNLINWMNSVEDIVNNMNVNKTYNYLSDYPQGFTRPVNSFNGGHISSLPSVDYNFEDYTLTGDQTNFLEWIVGLFFDSPLGFAFLVCLTFLVVKAVLH